jgi:hypothetical protein
VATGSVPRWRAARAVREWCRFESFDGIVLHKRHGFFDQRIKLGFPIGHLVPHTAAYSTKFAASSTLASAEEQPAIQATALADFSQGFKPDFVVELAP